MALRFDGNSWSRFLLAELLRAGIEWRSVSGRPQYPIGNGIVPCTCRYPARVFRVS